MSEPHPNELSTPPSIAPVFPLPDHVFLPASPGPYRVFEPRYRALIEHLLAQPEDQRWLAIPRLQPGWRENYEGSPAFHEIATVGRLVQCIPATDGTYHIVVDKGLRRRLAEVPSPHAFRLARLLPYPDEGPGAPSAEILAQFDALLQVVAALGRALGPGARGLIAIAQGKSPLDERVYRLGSVLLQNPDRRQDFLERRRVGERLDALLEAAAVLLTLATGVRDSGFRPPAS